MPPMGTIPITAIEKDVHIDTGSQIYIGSGITNIAGGEWSTTGEGLPILICRSGVPIFILICATESVVAPRQTNPPEVRKVPIL